MTPMTSNVLKVLTVASFCGLGFWGIKSQDSIKADIKASQATITQTKKQSKAKKTQAKQIIKTMPNTYAVISKKANQINALQHTLVSNTNVNSIANQQAQRQMNELINSDSSGWNAATTVWIADKSWNIQPVYSSAGTDGQYKVAFYMTDGDGTPVGLITAKYYNGQFHNFTSYYNQKGQDDFTKATIKNHHE